MSFHYCASRYGVVLVLALLTTAVAARTASLAESSVAFEVQPSEVTVDMGARSRTELLASLHSSSGTAIAGATLKFISPAGITVRAVPLAFQTTSSQLLWRVDVVGHVGASPTSKLIVLAAYGRAQTSELQTAVATVSLTVRPRLSAASVLQTTIFPAESNVDEFNPLKLTLEVENPTERFAYLRKIAVLAPRYVQLQEPPDGIVTIPPGNDITIPIKLGATQALPGTYSLVIAYRTRLRGNAGPWETAIAQSKITIGIPGVTEAMQYLGIPSLLLLPGVLMIIAFATLFALIARQPAVDLKQPWLLVLAVTLSFFVAFLYPHIAPHNFGEPRDYLRGYDLWDVIYLWVSSIFLGVLAGAIAAVTVQIRKRLLQPHESDSQLDVLQKLQRYRVTGFKLVQLRKRPGPNNEPPGPPMLVLPFGNAESGQLWLVPRARFRSVGVSDEAAKRVTDIEATLEQFDNPHNSIAENARLQRLLVELVKTGLEGNAPDIALSWDGEETSGPRKVDSATYVSGGEAKLAFLHAE